MEKKALHTLDFGFGTDGHVDQGMLQEARWQEKCPKPGDTHSERRTGLSRRTRRANEPAPRACDAHVGEPANQGADGSSSSTGQQSNTRKTSSPAKSWHQN